MEKQDETLMSLFDYLKKPAGDEGKKSDYCK